MAKKPQFTFTVAFSPRDLPGFLDVLRYDGSTVQTWDRGTPDLRTGRERFTVTLVGPRFTPDRWSSFGLVTRETDFQYV